MFVYVLSVPISEQRIGKDAEPHTNEGNPVGHKVTTRMKKFSGLMIIGALVLSGCSFSADTPDETSAAAQVLHQGMTPVNNLDPQFRSGAGGAHIMLAGLLEGLVVVEPGGDVVPGAATSWEISDDGTIYTFAINPEAQWSNGDPVTAQDFVWNWQRLLTPGEAGTEARAYEASVGVVGASEFFAGATTDFSTVGVKALSDEELEFTLVRPNPDFLSTLALHWGLPLHPATVEEFPDTWATPENWVGNGAYVLDEFRLNAGATLVPNEKYWNRDEYHLDEWDFRFSDGGDTAQLLAFQSGEIDVMRVEADLSAVTSDPDLLEQLVAAPANQIRSLQLMSSKNEALQDVRVREALSMAIDREALASIQAPDVPGTSLVPDAVPGSEDVAQTDYDPERARELLADAGYADGAGMPTITILTSQAAPFLEAIGEMWNKELGVTFSLDVVEAGVYVEKRAQLHEADYAGFYYINYSLTPPTAYRAATSAAGQRWSTFLLPADATAEYQAIGADTALSPQDKSSAQAEIIAQHAPKEWNAYVKALAAAEKMSAGEEQNAALLDAASKLEAVYARIPVLWGGYNLLVSSTVKGLEPWATSSVFSTKGVTIG